MVPYYRSCLKDYHTLICALALLSSPNVVCRLQSGPRGIRDFNLSKHRRRCARLWEETQSRRVISPTWSNVQYAALLTALVHKRKMKDTFPD